MPDNTDYKFELILEKMENLNDKYLVHANSDVEHFKIIRESLHKIEGKLEETLFNQETGIIIKLDRLHQDQKKRSWLIKTTFGAAISSVAASIWQMLKG